MQFIFTLPAHFGQCGTELLHSAVGLSDVQTIELLIDGLTKRRIDFIFASERNMPRRIPFGNQRFQGRDCFRFGQAFVYRLDFLNQRFFYFKVCGFLSFL